MRTDIGVRAPRPHLLRVPITMGLVSLLGACMPAPGEVSPEEIPELESKVQAAPQDGGLLLRYAAALFAADRCEDAVGVARRGQALRPASAVGPLVIGQCYERTEQYGQALAVYQEFTSDFPDERGVASVRARELLARRAQATQLARAAISREQELGQSLNPDAVAVLPLAIVGDSSVQPLGRGLAQMITSDLAILQRFQLVERMRIGAIMDELALAQTERVDARTTARVGRLVQAGRMVQGLATIPEDRDMRLEASVLQSDGEVSAPEAVLGRFRDLLQMEKELVVALAAQLGYQLTQAERQAILENGTRNLAAFLAYSLGLEAEDVGNYTLAASRYAEAVRADPSFQEARQRHQAASAAPNVQRSTPAQVTVVASRTVDEPDAFGADPTSDALDGAIGDLAATNAEQTTESADDVAGINDVSQKPGDTSASDRPSPEHVPDIGAVLNATIRIIFRIP